MNKNYIIFLIIGIIKISHIKVKGRIFFHKQFIKISYRSRGRAPRNQMKINDIIVVFIISSVFHIFLVNIDMVISLISKIFIYSAIKIKANIDLLYSILNPDTSSDSPSVKSNGAR